MLFLHPGCVINIYSVRCIERKQNNTDTVIVRFDSPTSVHCKTYVPIRVNNRLYYTQSNN